MNSLFAEPASEQQQKALLLDHILFEHYGGPFHFFSTKDPLSELVSALLSHRTKNKVSGQAYRQLRAAFPTWEAVREAPVEDIQQPISIVTFPEVKAPRIQQALRIITTRNNGKLTLDFIKEMPVPEARQWLEEIPGIGVKTSAAILNFSHLRLPALVVDTHHHRVAQRTGIVPPKASLDKTARLLESYLPSDWDGQRVYDNHQGFMRHGQKVCHWRSPNCGNCVIRVHCDYQNQERD